MAYTPLMSNSVHFSKCTWTVVDVMTQNYSVQYCRNSEGADAYNNRTQVRNTFLSSNHQNNDFMNVLNKWKQASASSGKKTNYVSNFHHKA